MAFGAGDVTPCPFATSDKSEFGRNRLFPKITDIRIEVDPRLARRSRRTPRILLKKKNKSGR